MSEEVSGSSIPTFPELNYEIRQPGVVTITLNRPHRLNALSHGEGGLHEQFVSAFQAADRDDDIRCVVLTGAGRAFCSGGDIGKDMGMETVLDWYEFMAEEDYDWSVVRNMRKPVIAAINGLCYGAGLMLAGHVDIRIASTEAKFGFIETRLGLNGIEVFPFLIGEQWSKFLMLTGEIISAEKAKEIGLIVETVAAELLEERVADLARRVAALPREGVMMNKRVVDAAMDMMGYSTNKVAARGLNAVLGAMSKDAVAHDGRKFSQISQDEGFKAMLAARDAPFPTPWLQQD